MEVIKNMERTIRRGDIYYAELNPVVGSEQGGTRPVLIISNNMGNRHSPTVIIAAITGRTRTKAKLPTHTEVKNFEGLDRDSIVLLEQIRTVDKKRLKQYMGMMPTEAMARVDKALAISISLRGGSNERDKN
jgi:mRNA interferase MazF